MKEKKRRVQEVEGFPCLEHAFILLRVVSMTSLVFIHPPAFIGASPEIRRGRDAVQLSELASFPTAHDIQWSGGHVKDKSMIRGMEHVLS
jgi:hypothetical protein